MPFKLQKTHHPKAYTGYEATYYEIVKVKNGIATCNTKHAFVALQRMGYAPMVTDEEQPEPIVEPSPEESTTDCPKCEGAPTEEEPVPEEEPSEEPKPKKKKDKGKRTS